ncbi:glyoxalase family protein [Filimonas lacunae]|uniref:Glyoxalase family protein n=1 Tax=Filimonas lacunae TaxID=477680 RepID=A0A173MFE8_9BACT|nr:ring-cleaving dioxygenase [Filimonas lacunae]BAV06216.1 glyoxalase family protein [Filimonas lacunae]SIT25311.1 glyoxalase family protein [Filimonas lacunae]
METTLKGIHHITAIAGDAKKNYDFYTRILGLRLVKKTVNFDDPNTYHFYYGDENGTPGTILTFFPWGSGISKGRRGTHQATEIGYAVPVGSLEFWQKRFEENNVIYNKPAEKFGQKYLTFLDPDGLKLELVETNEDKRAPWETSEVKAENATRGFHHITITTEKAEPTAYILTKVFGYKLQQQEVNRFRYVTDAVDTANIVDLVEVPGEAAGLTAGGSVHHVAFRVSDEATLMQYREKIVALGLHITEKIDRNYFYSLYFREPGGVLFEIATDNPGFATDETVAELGTGLKLPAQYEAYRGEIEKVLPKLD